MSDSPVVGSNTQISSHRGGAVGGGGGAVVDGIESVVTDGRAGPGPCRAGHIVFLLIAAHTGRATNARVTELSGLMMPNE